MSSQLRVVGVDPGLSRCGVGVVDGPAHRPAVVRAGVIRTAPGDPVGRRLARIHADLSRLLHEVRADAVALERVFFNSNVSTAMGVGQAAGVALLAAEQAGVPVVEYTPSQVKSVVAGDGAAEKEQVAYMVRTLLRLERAPQPADVADALALALCHLSAGPAAGEMSPRLRAAYVAATPGAQVVRP